MTVKLPRALIIKIWQSGNCHPEEAASNEGRVRFYVMNINQTDENDRQDFKMTKKENENNSLCVSKNAIHDKTDARGPHLLSTRSQNR